MSVCEIRIPTYRRPELLRRALDTLRRQTVKDIHIVIFDDSPDAEGRAVAEEASDLTIHYRQNAGNLGISRNLGQCFQTGAFYPAEYAFCLEDDNMVFPDFIEKNIAAMKKSGTAILVRNQFIESTDNEILHHRKTMPDAFSEGIVNPSRLLACIFTNVGISNGGLFWRCDARSELQIGDDCPNPVLIEYLRPFAIAENVWYADEPLGTWRDNQVESFRILKDGLEDRLYNYRLLKTLSCMRRKTLAALTGGDPAPLYAMTDQSRWPKIDAALATALLPVRRQGAPARDLVKHYARGFAASLLSQSAIGDRSAAVFRNRLAGLAGAGSEIMSEPAHCSK